MGKPWTTIDSLSIIWKSNLSNKLKQEFLQTVAIVLDFNIVLGETTEEYCMLFGINPGSSASQNNSCMVPYLLSHKPSK